MNCQSHFSVNSSKKKVFIFLRRIQFCWYAMHSFLSHFEILTQTYISVNFNKIEKIIKSVLRISRHSLFLFIYLFSYTYSYLYVTDVRPFHITQFWTLSQLQRLSYFFVFKIWSNVFVLPYRLIEYIGRIINF